jgi:hypothetical protein
LFEDATLYVQQVVERVARALLTHAGVAFGTSHSVLIAAQVQRQVAGLFVVEERGCHQLKGVPQPVTLFRLIRASGGGRRSGVRQLSPLVGREEEIAMLMRRWERAGRARGN